MEQPNHRIQRINELIWRELIILLKTKVKDPRLVNISITEVITSRDLGSSKVFFHTTEEDIVEVTHTLKGVSGFLRSHLAKNLRLRHTPQLQFKYDSSQNTASRIEELIAQL